MKVGFAGDGAEGGGADRRPVTGERLDGTTFLVSETLGRRSVRFRVARLIGTQACADRLDALVAEAGLSSPEAALPLRRALASYFAGALLMPYAPFRAAVDSLRFRAMGSDTPSVRSPAEFTAFVERERRIYAELVKRSGASAD